MAAPRPPQQVPDKLNAEDELRKGPAAPQFHMTTQTQGVFWQILLLYSIEVITGWAYQTSEQHKTYPSADTEDSSRLAHLGHQHPLGELRENRLTARGMPELVLPYRALRDFQTSHKAHQEPQETTMLA